MDIAVNVAQKAYKTSWGRRCAAYDRGRLLNKLADIMEQHVDELCALESLDTGSIFLPEKERHRLTFLSGKNFAFVRMGDFNSAVRALRFFAGWADKNSGKTIEVRTRVGIRSADWLTRTRSTRASLPILAMSQLE